MLTKLQALRGWAALAVFFFHLGGAVAAPKYFGLDWAAGLTQFGRQGVLVFFVLSGFIIHAVHRRDIGRPENLAGYAKRRALRLFPVYWTVLALVAGSSIITGIGIEGVPSNPGTLLRTVLLLPQDPSKVGGTGAPILIVAWSLQYELLFYAAFALFILNRSVGLISISLVLTAMLVLIGGGHTDMFPAYLTPKYFAFFAIGVATSAMLNKGLFGLAARAAAATGGILLIIGWLFDIFAGIAVPEGRSSISLLPVEAAICLASALLIGGLAARELADGARALQWQQKLGDWSYGLYLVHFPVISIACKAVLAVGLHGVAGASLAAVLSLCGALSLAAALHYLVERPFQNYARTRLARA